MISGRSLGGEARLALWTEVLEIAVGCEGAEEFIIEPATATSKRATEPSLLAWIESLGPSPRERRHRLDAHLDNVRRFGMEVLAVMMWRGEERVAGVSDWGDDIDFVATEACYRRLAPALAALGLSDAVEVEELLD